MKGKQNAMAIFSKKRLKLKPKICITVPLIYPLFKKGLEAPFGGIEVRISVLARALASQGNFDVNIVVGDYGQPHVEKIDGITFYSWQGRSLWGVQKVFKDPALPSNDQANGPANNQPRPRVSLYEMLSRVGAKIYARLEKLQPYMGPFGKLLRPIKKRVIKLFNFGHMIVVKLSLVSLLKKIKGSKDDQMSTVIAGYAITRSMLSIYDEVDADLYLVPGNSHFSAEIAFYCRKRHKKYILIGASEMDFYPEYKTGKGNDIYGVPFALKAHNIMSAHGHIVQNPGQQEMLWKGYGITSTVIKNPVDLTPLFPVPEKRDTILWIGKSHEPIKQPSIALRLARELPGYPFVVVMNKNIEETHQKCLREAGKLSNVTLIERVPFEEIERYFAEARLHINTSSFEGFPNTFLQAAKYGVPTVSLQVDPAGMLSEHGCGLVSGGDYLKFKSYVQDLMENQMAYMRYSDHALEYLQKYHNKDIIAAEYETVLFSFTK
jgi:glycosyltransferase involved in cell wall biosynthesis